MSRVHDRVRVLVVGAGLAGLRCAELLQRSGVTTELHEASERLGGRCWSAHGLADGIVAEHGGELIAPDHRRVAALANELGLQLEDRMAATPPALRSGAIVFEGRRVGPGEGTAEMARVFHLDGPAAFEREKRPRRPLAAHATVARAEIMIAPALQTEGKNLQKSQGIGMGH